MKKTIEKQKKPINPYLRENCDEIKEVPVNLWAELVATYQGAGLTDAHLELVSAAVNEVEGYPACSECQRSQATNEPGLCDDCFPQFQADTREERENQKLQ